jgi:ABC-type lipoprotein export system ATPase subunit
MEDSFAVEMREVSKHFPGPGGQPDTEVVAVDHVSIQIRDGEFFSLLGPSGCGKTTSLRMIAGFEYPSAGEVYIRGQPMGLTPPYQRNTNMVFQSYALFPHMTIARNVAFGLEMKKVPKAEVARRVQEALQMVRLDDYGPRKPDQLSGGQQQRVALARALVNRPEVLLLERRLFCGSRGGRAGLVHHPPGRRGDLDRQSVHSQVGTQPVHSRGVHRLLVAAGSGGQDHQLHLVWQPQQGFGGIHRRGDPGGTGHLSTAGGDGQAGVHPRRGRGDSRL